MKKSIKGALATAGAAALLLGGATSLAYWTASQSVNGGSLTAGELALGAGTCDADWVYADGQAGAGETVVAWVPGDVVSKSCTFTVTAVGDNLLATLSAPDSVALTTASTDAAPTGTATVSVDYLLDGAALVDADPAIDGTQITEAAADRTLTATINVTFPYGDATDVNANDTQGWEAAFDAVTITLTQLNPN